MNWGAAVPHSVLSGILPPFQLEMAPLVLFGFFHINRHVLHTDELQQESGQDKAVSVVEPGDEAFLDGANVQVMPASGTR